MLLAATSELLCMLIFSRAISMSDILDRYYILWFKCVQMYLIYLIQ